MAETRASAPPAAQTAVPAQGASPAAGRGFPDIAPLKNLFAGICGRRTLNLATVNAALAVLIVLLGALLVWQMVSSYARLQAVEEGHLAVVAADQEEQGFKDIPALPPATFYLKKITRRDLFSRGDRPAPSGQAESSSTKAAEMAQALKLVGISWSASPDAMIENAKEGKTYFVKQGMSVGEFKVENILKDKVILRYNKETVELK